MGFKRKVLYKNDIWWIDDCDHYFEKILLELSTKTPIKQMKFSEIVFTERFALKKIKIQKAKDHFVKLVNPQALREKNSSLILNSLGIPSPKIYCHARNILFGKEYESILLMEKIDNIGTVRELLTSTIDQKTRKKLLERIIMHIQIMISNGIYHKDAHYNNLLLSKNFDVVWIDNDIGKISDTHHLLRFVRKFIKPNYISLEEKEMFFRKLPLENIQL